MLNQRLFDVSGSTWLLGAVILTLVIVACGSDTPPSLEEQAQSIDKLLMCPVCPAETIDQAQVPLARDMQAFVREKLAEGWTKRQILDFFSAPERYGPGVLAEPPKSGANLTIWVVPPIGVVLGAVGIFFTVRSMQRRRADASEEEDLSDEELEPYLAQVDAELEARFPTGPYNQVDSDNEEQEVRPATTDEGALHG